MNSNLFRPITKIYKSHSGEAYRTQTSGNNYKEKHATTAWQTRPKATSLSSEA